MGANRVRDLMLSLDQYATCGAGQTIKEALQVLSEAQLGLSPERQHHRAVLVLDGQGRALGKLSHWAILKALRPMVLSRADRSSLDRSGIPEHLVENLEEGLRGHIGSLDQVCRLAGDTPVTEAMVPVGESIDRDAPLMEAIERMVEEHVQSLTVTHRGRLVGILRMSDVFEEVARRIRAGTCQEEAPRS